MNSTLKGKMMANNEMLATRVSRNSRHTGCYISVDIEATGPTPGHYSMYELGACVVGSSEQFERALTLLPNAACNTNALRAVGMTKKKLLERSGAVTPKRAMHEFAKWAEEVSHGDKLIFVANNAPFDWMFVAWYFEEVRVKNPFGHAALDMKAYFMGKTGFSWSESNLAKMAQYAEIRFDQLPHKALLDAIIQEQIFVGIHNPAKKTL